MPSSLFLTMIHALGLMALCTLAYGYAQRSLRARLARHGVIGIVLGLGSAISMLEPFAVVQGYQVDGRNMFLAISTAFGGALSSVIAVAIAILVRLLIGGPGAVIGVLSIAMACILAALWAHWSRTETRRSWAAWIVLGVILSAPLLIGMTVLGTTETGPALARVGTDMIGALVFGKMFEGEQRRGRRERQLNLAASTDPLTGLPNRRAMMGFVDNLPAADLRGMALLIIDADHFKMINDTHGHDVGDQVLKAIADTLKGAIRQGDFAARFGGEEFAVLLKVPQQGDGYAVADRLRNMLSRPHLIAGQKIHVTVSIGGTRLPAAEFDFASAYAKADAALYEAKRLGRDRVVFS